MEAGNIGIGVDSSPLERQRPARFGQSRPPRIGILGGGQLAKMLAMAGQRLGCQIYVAEQTADCPAAPLANQFRVIRWEDTVGLQSFFGDCDVVTLENEFIPLSTLNALQAAGVTLRPSVRTFALVQDKWVQKHTLANAGLRVPRCVDVTRPEQVETFGASWGWPLLLKCRYHGYDGKGNRTLRSAEDIGPAWEELSRGGRPLMAEVFCPFVMELAVIVTRAPEGQTEVYPVVQTVQTNHVCSRVLAPARLPEEVGHRAAQMARAAIEAIEGVGSFGVEMFLDGEGGLWINELAPRVHNSGHYTIEACQCSQFENHLRAILGWPLGSGRMVAPAAAMVNLLGTRSASGWPVGLERALAVAGAYIHLYGKTAASPGRKMGHVTALGATLEEAMRVASEAAEALQFVLAAGA